MIVYYHFSTAILTHVLLSCNLSGENLAVSFSVKINDSYTPSHVLVKGINLLPPLYNTPNDISDAELDQIFFFVFILRNRKFK